MPHLSLTHVPHFAFPIAVWLLLMPSTELKFRPNAAWNYANEFVLPRFMVINKLDKERADFGHALDTATEHFSRAIVPFTLPIGQEENFKGVIDVVHMKAYEFDENGKAKERDMPEKGREILDATRERLVEIVAESDDELLEKYFENGTLEEEDILLNLSKAIAKSKLCPVYAVSSETLVGLSILLDHIVEFAPHPGIHESEIGHETASEDSARKTANTATTSLFPPSFSAPLPIRLPDEST